MLTLYIKEPVLKLTPLEIRNQEFRKALRGLDPVEVQTFLEMVSEHYEQLAEENKSLNRRIIELETKLKDYQENEKNLRETLLNVQEVKKQSEESSRRQADLIIKEAELKSLEILENARKQTRQIREEVSWLKAQKESFINRLRYILVSQIELLSVMEIDDVLPAGTHEALKGLKSRKATHSKPPEPEKNVEDQTKEDQEVSNPPQEIPELEESDMPEVDLEVIETSEEEETEAETRLIQRMDSSEVEEVPAKPKKKTKKDEDSMSDEDINDFFKKGIHIDELIKTINKKEFDK
jgi:cell division initiation protein